MSSTSNVTSTTKPAPSFTNPDPHALAIVGMSIKAPSGGEHGLDTEEFYEFLKGRGSGLIKVPADRWNADQYFGYGPGQICSDKGNFIPDVLHTDPQEFGITPAEASQMASNQKALLHQAFNALQRSGIDYRGSTTGVYVGCAGGGVSYDQDPTEAGAYYMTGTSLAIAANRISYVFDMMGPSLPVDTACSSSLFAMHLGMNAVRNGECDQAVVAGANILLDPLESISFSQLGVLSKDGISKSFSDDANGYSRGEVVSAVVIKRHDLAVRDKDYIHATMVGTSLSSCGSLMGSLTTPSAQAQALAINNAYRDAGLEPRQADFVELHGTGTVVGDKIEANAAGELFSEGRGGREIVIGSVKSNVGHGEMGAYMNSLIKVVTMLERHEIIPNGYFKERSKAIRFDDFNLRVPLEVEQWVPGNPQDGLIASISSFGFGGSCGHTVLREHERRPVAPDHETLKKGPFLFAIGGLSPRATVSLVDTYKTECSTVPSSALSEHLGSRARQSPWRTFAVGDSLESLTFPEPVMAPKRATPLALCFSGQGPQHWFMGRDLFATFAVFRESILKSDAVYKEYEGKSFLEESQLFIGNPDKNHPLAKSMSWPASVISVSITFFQMALYDLLMSLGLNPSVVVGHSIGETASLYASGAMPHSMVVKVSIARGRALQLVDNVGGAMIALSGCDATAAQDYAESAVALTDMVMTGHDGLYMATLNSPNDFGISGSDRLVDELSSYIEKWVDGVTARKLRVSTAVHSPYVDPCEKQYRSELATIFAQYEGPFTPKTPIMSTVTAEFVTEAYTVEYLWQNLRQPVRFSEAIPKMLEKYGEDTAFVECSPHPVLSQYMKDMGVKEAVASSKRPPSAKQIKAGVKATTELHTLLEALGTLLVAGVNSISFATLNGCPAEHFRGPAYPFQIKNWQHAPKVQSYARKLLPPTRPLNSEALRISPQLPLSACLKDHIIDHSNLIPAAAYVEMALEFPEVTGVWDCRFEAAFILDDAVSASTLKIAKDGVNWSVRSSSGLQSMAGDLEWTRTGPAFDTLHSYGKLAYGQPELSPGNFTHVDIDAVLKRCPAVFERDLLYNELEGIAQFGPEFKRLQKAAVNEKEAVTWIKGHADGLNSTDYTFHPALMDAVFQSVISWNMLYDHVHVAEKDRNIMLPHSLRRGFRNDGSSTPLVLPEIFRVYSVNTAWSPESVTLDCYVLGEDNSVLFTFEGLRFNRVTQGESWPTERFVTVWQPHSLPPTQLSGSVIVHGADVGDETHRLLTTLDNMAVKSLGDALKALPADFTPASDDRKEYLEWAKKVVGQAHGASAESQASFNEKYAVLFELTHRIADGQKAVFSSANANADFLASDDILRRVFDLAPFSGAIVREAIPRFLKLVQAAKAAGKRVIRVLEVGCGTGRFSAALGQALADAALEGIYVDYVTADANGSLAQQATAASPWLTIAPLTFDVNAPLNQQEIDRESYDIIVAFEALSTTTSVAYTLSAINDLLLPGGHLLSVEFDGRSFTSKTAGSTWIDFVFGTGRATTQSNLSRSQWALALGKAGFRDSLFITEDGDSVAHVAFVTQKPAEQTTFPGFAVADTPALETPGFITPSSGASTDHSEAPTPPAGEFDPVSADTPPIASSYAPYAAPKEELLSELLRSRVLAEKVAPQVSAVTDAATDGVLIRRFVAGGEVDLVNFISMLDQTTPHVLFLYSDTKTTNAVLLGLARTLRLEFGLWRIQTVLFHPSWTPARQEQFVRSRLAPLQWIDAEVVVDQNGVMTVPRIIAAPQPPATEPAQSKPIQFDNTDIWRAFPPVIGAHDVEVAVSYIAMSETIPGASEFSGKITAVGQSVSDISLIGKRVVGVAPTTKGSVIVCPRANVAVLPKRMDRVTAASVIGRLLFAYGVVAKALKELPAKASRALLHGGAFGPAAAATYEFLKARNFDVIVTADDVSASRIPTSAKALPSDNLAGWSLATRAWAPQGVDVAFSFDQTVAVADETTNLLRAEGSFVLVGDSFPSKMRRGQKYTSVDYERLVAGDGNFLESIIAEADSTTTNTLAPATRVYKIDQLATASAHAEASATSTVLVELSSIPANLPVLRGGLNRKTAAFNPRASYVVIGGVGGLGASLARCLVENGARHIVLTSRSGEKAFANGNFVKEKKTLDHLRTLPGVTIEIAAVDCLDAAKTKALFANLARPVAGIFYVAVRLNDQLFTNLTKDEDWTKVYDVKVKGLHILLDAVDPNKLDFLVLTSSMATVCGSPGQSNYSACQTEMEALGATIPNCVTVTVPPLTDGGVLVRAMPKDMGRNAALDKYKSLGMTGYRLAEHCVDAIWTLHSESFSPVYIPSIAWKKVLELGMANYTLSLARHLLVKEATEAGASKNSAVQTLRGACAAVLSLEVEDLEDSVPLASYGLDSLTSVRLSGILKAYFDVNLTQMQLLSSAMTISRLEAIQIEQREAAAASEGADAAGTGASGDATTHEVDFDQTVIRLNNVTEGRPLFIVHGAGGGIMVMMKLASKLSVPVFGVQDTNEAPITGTLQRLSEFYLAKIREKQPHGPYRLAGFSFGSCLVYFISRLLQDAGETVELMVMLDGAPTLFQRARFGDWIKKQIHDGTLRDDILEVVRDMASSGALDDAETVPGQFEDHFAKQKEGGSGAKWIARFCRAYVGHISMGIRASKEIEQQGPTGNYLTGVWPSKRTVLVRATKGLGAEPYSAGASRAFDLEKYAPRVELFELPGSHFSLLNPKNGLDKIIQGLISSPSKRL